MTRLQGQRRTEEERRERRSGEKGKSGEEKCKGERRKLGEKEKKGGTEEKREGGVRELMREQAERKRRGGGSLCGQVMIYDLDIEEAAIGQLQAATSTTHPALMIRLIQIS